MKLSKYKFFVLSALLLPMSAFCTGTNAQPLSVQRSEPSTPSGSSLTATDAPESNFGVYEWDVDSQSWLLAADLYVPSANDQPQSGDDFWPESVFHTGGATYTAPSSGGGGPPPVLQSVPPGNGSKRSLITAAETPTVTFPTVYVSGRRTGETVSGIIYTTIRRIFVDGGSGGAQGRKVVGKRKKADPAVTCASDAMDREFEALRVIGKPYQAGLYLIEFGNGGFQLYSINSPLMSNGGIVEMSACKAG